MNWLMNVARPELITVTVLAGTVIGIILTTLIDRISRKRQLGKLNNQIDQLAQENYNVNTQLTNTHDELAGVRQSFVDYSEQASTLTENLSLTEGNLNRTKSELAVAKNRVTDVRKMETEINNLKIHLDRAKTRGNQFEETLARVRKESKMRGGEVRAITAERDELQTKLRDRAAELTLLESENRELQLVQNSAQGDTALLLSELAATREKLDLMLISQIAAVPEPEPEFIEEPPKPIVRDRLQLIEGIGDVFCARFYDAEVYQFQDLAVLSPDLVEEIANPESWQQINTSRWIAEAKFLATQDNFDFTVSDQEAADMALSATTVAAPVVKVVAPEPVIVAEVIEAEVVEAEVVEAEVVEAEVVEAEVVEAEVVEAEVVEAEVVEAEVVEAEVVEAEVVEAEVVEAEVVEAEVVEAEVVEAEVVEAEVVEAEVVEAEVVEMVEETAEVEAAPQVPAGWEPIAVTEPDIVEMVEAEVNESDSNDVASVMPVAPETESASDIDINSGGKRDRLQRIYGIGNVYARRLNAAGVFTFGDLSKLQADQIAAIVRPKPWQQIEPETWITEAESRSKA